MSRGFRRALATAAVVLTGGCDIGGRIPVAEQTGGQGGDPAPFVAPASGTSSAIEATDLPGVEPDVTVPPTTAEDLGATSSPDQSPPAVQELTVDQRMQLLLDGQELLSSRVDSLTRALGADTVGTSPVASGSGEVLGDARDQVRSFGVGIVWSVLVIILFNLTIGSLVWLLDALAERSATRRLFYKRLAPIVRIVLWVFAAYLIISVIFRVDAQGLLAAAAAVGVAVGFAAQDLLKNLFGGLILVFDQPFQVGDKISVGGTYGEVVSIGLRSTRLVTADDNRVSVPNAQVVDQQVANANAGELNCQVVIDLYLPGWADEARAKKIAFEAASSSKYVYLNKPIVTLVKDEFKETFLTRVRVKAYVLDPRLEFLFHSDVTERARAGFRAAGLLRPDDVAGPFSRVRTGSPDDVEEAEDARAGA